MEFHLKIVCGVRRRSFLYDEECLSLRTDEMFVPVKRQNVVMYKYGTYDYLYGLRSRFEGIWLFEKRLLARRSLKTVMLFLAA